MDEVKCCRPEARVCCSGGEDVSYFSVYMLAYRILYQNLSSTPSRHSLYRASYYLKSPLLFTNLNQRREHPSLLVLNHFSDNSCLRVECHLCILCLPTKIVPFRPRSNRQPGLR
jgi:hypothetical protein